MDDLNNKTTNRDIDFLLNYVDQIEKENIKNIINNMM